MPSSPSQAGRYEIEGLIGRGGMAVVHLALDPVLGRRVALKELAAVHVDDPELAQRFVREARLASALNHPNLVTVFEYFEHDGVPFIAMEYLPRGSLRPALGSLSPAQIGGVLEGMLAGLAEAGARGIVHRDLKPENVLITDDGRVKIADFGIAKAVEGLSTGFRTATGRTIGTPAYMAPEQAMDRELGPWTDLYSTGVMAYEMLGGRTPFADTPAPMAVLMKHISEPPPPLAALRPDVDPRLIWWVERLLAKDPAARPANAREAWDSLDEILVEVLGPRWQRAARLVAAPAPPSGAPVALPPPPPRPTPATPRLPTRPTRPTLPPARAMRRRGPRKRLLAAGGGLFAAAAVALATVLLLGGGGGDSPPANFGTGLKQALAPLQRANGDLSEELFSLGLDVKSPAPAQDRAKRARAAVDDAGGKLDDLRPAAGRETTLRDQAKAALASEKDYLALVDKILAKRASDAEIGQLAERSRAVQDRYKPLASTVTGIALSISGAEGLEFWALGGEAGLPPGTARDNLLDIGAGGTIRRIGPLLDVKRLTVADALSAFGVSSAGTDLGGGCPDKDRYEVALPRLGATINGANYDNPSKCAPTEYELQSVDLQGKAARTSWKTDRGLRIGDSRERMVELYPKAHRKANQAGFWELIADSKLQGVTILSAYVKDGQVAALYAFVGVTD